jgi:hypothetical protein
VSTRAKQRWFRLGIVLEAATGEARVDDLCLSTLVAANGVLYLRTNSKLFALTERSPFSQGKRAAVA